MQNPFLIGETIYLRPLEQEDAPLFVRWLNHPDIQSTTLRARPLNLQDEEEFIDRMRQSNEDVALVIVAKEGDIPLGGTALIKTDWRCRSTEFGISIGESELWGQGYGTEATRLMAHYAFATLNLNRVWLQVLEYNERAIRCYEKVGFKKEGLLRQEHYRHGRYWNTYLMAMLREEWSGQKQ
jgi:[ribosomal protein S5]-alanine N-acetyltransferase